MIFGCHFDFQTQTESPRQSPRVFCLALLIEFELKEGGRTVFMLRSVVFSVRGGVFVQPYCTLTQKPLITGGLFVFSRKKRLSFTVAPFIESYGLEPLTCFIVLTEQMFCDKIYILYIHCIEGVFINDIGRIK